MSVNEKIRLIRETKGLTQEQVAEKIGISASVYGDIERGENDPKLSKLQKIAEFFEISSSELLDLTDKTVLNINFKHKNKGNSKYSVFVSSDSDIEKQQLINEMQQKEIENLKKQIAQLEEINVLLKKNQ